MKEKKLILFDFDGTITNKDSFFLFIKYYVGWSKLIVGFVFLAPVLFFYKTGLIPNWRAKEIVLTYFFKGQLVDIFSRKAEIFSLEIIPSIIKPKATEIIREYLNKGDAVVIVSASIDFWLKPWCDLNGLQLISSSLIVEDGKITGKLNGPNCYGLEKVKRIKERFDLTRHIEICAYGDSKGDKEMLDLAHKKYYRKLM